MGGEGSMVTSHTLGARRGMLLGERGGEGRRCHEVLVCGMQACRIVWDGDEEYGVRECLAWAERPGGTVKGRDIFVCAFRETAV